MANLIILPAQTVSVKELVGSIPKKIRKIFFQTELVSVNGNDITCRVIAYAAHKNIVQRWELGKKVSATVDPTGGTQTFTLPIAVGNCEWIMSNVRAKRKNETNAAFAIRKKQAAAIKKIHKLMRDKTLLKNASLSFSAKKSSNPHLEYAVTLDSGDGTSDTAYANPSPPATPAP